MGTPAVTPVLANTPNHDDSPRRANIKSTRRLKLGRAPTSSHTSLRLPTNVIAEWAWNGPILCLRQGTVIQTSSRLRSHKQPTAERVLEHGVSLVGLGIRRIFRSLPRADCLHASGSQNRISKGCLACICPHACARICGGVRRTPTGRGHRHFWILHRNHLGQNETFPTENCLSPRLV